MSVAPDPAVAIDRGDAAERPVELADVSVTIAGRPVLRCVDLAIGSGEFVAVLGANGSGKSTLVRALTGLRPLARGEVRLFGTPLDRFADWHRLGYVPQRSGAGAGVPASVREVVSAGRLSHRRLLRPLRAADRRAISEAIELVGLADRQRDAVSTLSGGQQQRVLIARALATEPDLLVLDEPTAGVDLHHQQVLADTLALLHGRGATVVLVAHELGPLAPLVDRTVVMREGLVVHDGALADVEPAWLGFDHGHHHDHAGRSGGHDDPGENGGRPGGPPDHAPVVRSPLENHR